MRSGRTRVEGVDLDYEIRGDGGSPVLLIPGANGDGDSYAAVADLLSLWLGPAIGGIRFIVGIRVPVRRLVAAHRQAVRYAQDHPVPGPIQPRVSAGEGIQVLVNHELLPVTNFLPDLAELRARQTSTVVAVSAMAVEKSTWLAVITRVLSDRLACRLSVAPGHHGSYEDIPDEWAAWLRTTLPSVQPPGSA